MSGLPFAADTITPVTVALPAAGEGIATSGFVSADCNGLFVTCETTDDVDGLVVGIGAAEQAVMMTLEPIRQSKA